MDVAKSVVELKEKHCQTWRNKPQWYWAMGLLEEVVELIGALLGLHKGPVEWELMQMAAICMNWIELRNPQSLPTQRAGDGESTRPSASRWAVHMDYEIEFERLMGYAEQALSGVDVEKREVLGFLGLGILADVVQDYRNRLTQHALDGCSYSPDKKHSFDGSVVEICSYCEARRQ